MNLVFPWFGLQNLFHSSGCINESRVFLIAFLITKKAELLCYNPTWGNENDKKKVSILINYLVWIWTSLYERKLNPEKQKVACWIWSRTWKTKIRNSEMKCTMEKVNLERIQNILTFFRRQTVIKIHLATYVDWVILSLRLWCIAETVSWKEAKKDPRT